MTYAKSKEISWMFLLILVKSSNQLYDNENKMSCLSNKALINLMPVKNDLAI